MIAVAIDGPAGAGKSTVARRVSSLLNYIYVDTGALYRAVGYYMLRKGIAPEETEKIAAELQSGAVEVDIRFIGGEQHVFLCGEDVNSQIRTPQISMAASKVSAIGAVRTFLLELQRKLARENNVIMDGRDIGTVVLPHAQVKIFLTASAEERARRRCLELCEKGTPQPFPEVLRDIEQRDEQDRTRAIAPLKQAEDAVFVDSSALSFEEVVEKVIFIIHQKI